MTVRTFYYNVLLCFGFDLPLTALFISQALNAKVQWMKRNNVYHLTVTPKELP